MRPSTLRLSALLIAIGAAACQGSTPPAEEPQPTEREPASTPAPTAPPAGDAGAAEASAPAEEETSPDPPADEAAEAPESDEPADPGYGMKPTRPPMEIIGGPRVAFAVQYASSDVKDAAREKCEEKTGDDLKARADCMREARDEFVADVLVFKQGPREKWQWLVYRRKGGTLFEVSKSYFELGEQTDTTVELLLTGKGKGSRPLFINAENVVVTVPNDSELQLDDPRYGKLVYEAKIGMLD